VSKKVAMFIYNVGGGAGINFLRLAERLALQNNVEFIYKKTSYPLADCGATYKRVSSPRVFISIFPLLLSLLRSKPDILISTVLQNNIVIALCGLILRREYIVRETGVISEYLKDKTPIVAAAYRFSVKLLYSRAAAVIAISNDIKSDLVLNYKIDPLIIEVIGNPAFSEDIDKKSLDDSDFDAALRYKRYIVVVGRLEKEKRFSDVVKAYALAKNHYDELVIVGEGREERSLKCLATSLGINEMVRFVGFKKNPYPYIKYAQLLVLSSEREGFGNVVVEALALGCNVVVTNCPGGPKDIIENGVYGAQYSVGDVDALGAILLSDGWRKDKDFLVNRAKSYKSSEILSRYEAVIFNREGR